VSARRRGRLATAVSRPAASASSKLWASGVGCSGPFERLDRVLAVSGVERVCHVLERAGHLPQDRLRRGPHEPERVDRQEHEAEQQRARRADQDVEAAAEAEALGLLEDHHEHRRHAGLGDHRGAAAEQHCCRHGEGDDHDQLPGPAADQVDQDVADEDAQRDADRGLDRPPPRCPALSPRISSALIGAKNGLRWPTTSVATSHASAVANAAWARYGAVARSRCSRTLIWFVMRRHGSHPDDRRRPPPARTRLTGRR
jgi:hypothetical protein